ncbi:hypothetical protein [Hymenobacter ruricola]|uniref:Uncharacterized protein n=1 Tax=Hymenobacter ruricola TaxID=2791023 RepID=A0ABS0I2W7_9BACT|nr:hypothetical protein [Hymenobacter ruricola]MBF9220904.1 hypothetical protein [Hymenobacter ruricola]
MLEVLAALWGLALLGMGLSALAYWKPNSWRLAAASYAVNAVGLLPGLVWEQVFSRDNGGGIPFFGDLNPFLAASLPFAVWLWAASKVAGRTQPQASTWGVALALVGASFFLNQGLFWVLRWLLFGSLVEVYRTVYWQWLVGPMVLFGIWWLVLRQLQRFRPLGWPARAVWLVPGQALLLSTALGCLPLLSVLPRIALDPRWLVQFLGHALLSYAIGVLALWLNQQRHQRVAQD